MSSQLQQLLDSTTQTWKTRQSEAVKLAKKWERTGLLKGLNENGKNAMSLMLENQTKQLITEASLSGAGTAGGTFTVGVGEQWAGVALPMVRKVFGQIVAQEFLSVQPMNLPSGLVFFLDFQYGTNKEPFTSGSVTDVYNTSSLYGLTEGPHAPSEGLYGAGRFSYTINNTQSTVPSASLTVTAADWTSFNYDARFSGSAADSFSVIGIDLNGLNADLRGARAFYVTGSTGTNEGLEAFTKLSGSTAVRFIVPSGSQADIEDVKLVYQLQPTDNRRGDFEDMNTSLNAGNNNLTIPEINVKMKSEAIVAKTRKLKAVWTPEFAQDLNAYQSLDAEAELTSVMSEYISMEIDLELLDMLITSVPLGSKEVWSAKNNEAITNLTTTDLGFFNQQGTWFQTLGTKINKLSNRIHQLTLRGGANFMVLSPSVSTIIESMPGFASNPSGDVAKNKYAFGVQKMGSFNSQYDVYKIPYMLENQILVGFRGSQFLETGAVFSPYIPLIMTPLVYDPDTFTPRKGLMTRYAKKMIRPEFYGLIQVAGLNTI